MTDEYNKARKRGEKTIRDAVLRGEYPNLPCLDDLVPQPETLSSVRLGLLEIPLDQIRGTKTKGRQTMFAPDFMPVAGRNTEFAMKWVSLYEYQTREGITDPVSVYEYRHAFYVLEGNKRVSVLKYLDSLTISAEVTRLIPADEDPLYREFLDFYRVCPLYEMNFHRKGSYRKLARLLKQTREEPWDKVFVSRLRAAYYLFRRVYAKLGYDPAFCGDAFLTYVSAYDLDGIRSLDDASLAAKIRKIRNEIPVSEDTENVKLLEDPSLSDASVNILKMIPFMPGERELRAGFIYEKDAVLSAADYDYELGRLQAAAALRGKVITTKYENCEGERLAGALRKAAAENDVVFTTSPLQFEETFRAAVRHPGVRFLNHSVYMKQNALRTYDVRMYEAKFLLGALAAVFSKDHQIGYIADSPVYGSFADINAFAIGAGMIDPQAKVWLGWKETLDKDWQEQMKRIGIRIFSGPELPDFRSDTTEYGLYAFTEEGLLNLAQPVVSWGVYYRKLLESILDGTWEKDGEKDRAVNYWWGMAAGVIDVNVSGVLHYESRKLIGLLKNALISARMDPFAGELRAQDRLIQGPYAQKLPYEKIIKMNWLNDNVIGVIPAYHQLSDRGKELAEISGIDL